MANEIKKEVVKQSPFIKEEVSKPILVLISDTELKIKLAIKNATINGTPRQTLLKNIITIINDFSSKAPTNLIDKQNYLNGLWFSANKWIKEVYNPMINLQTSFRASAPFGVVKLISEEKVMDLTQLAKLFDKKHPYVQQASFEEYRTFAVSYIEDYQRKLVRKLRELGASNASTASSALTISKEGKRPISLWQKVEIDLRQEGQAKAIEEAKSSGTDLWYIVPHPNCSKRCEPDQDKIISMSLPAVDNLMRTGKKVDGKVIYSWEAMKNRVDKYGYNNFIITGFNCRHRIVPYVKGEKYLTPNAKQIEADRQINDKMRKMETWLRSEINQAKMIREKDPNAYKKLIANYNLHYNQYVEYAKKHNVAFYPYRCK